MSLSSEVVSPTHRRSPPKRTSLPAADRPPDPPEPMETAKMPSPEDSAALAEAANDHEEGADVTRLSGRVRFARTFAKLSKAELSRRVGVCLSAAVQWELPRGTSPNVTNLIRIATITGVGFEWLTTGRGSPALLIDSSFVSDTNDLEFEIRLLEAVRTIARDRREILLEVARSMVEP